MKLQKDLNTKPTFAYVNFFSSPHIKNKEEKLHIYRNAFDFLFKLQDYFNITVYDFIGASGSFKKEDITFIYFKNSSKSKLRIPLKLFLKLNKLKPKVVYVQGLGYPHLIIIMKWFLHFSAKIIVHDHANKLPSSWKYPFFKKADKSISYYFFTSKQQAMPWISKGLISSEKKVVECIEGSTSFQFNGAIKKDSNSFLWVGRLDENKDPLSVLKAFSNYIKIKPTAKLNMFFEDTTLLNEVEQTIIDLSLKNHVFLKGAVSNSSLELWFQKSEFFILGSHKEGGPFSLIEAMACGCIPIVTNIAPFLAMTNNGDCGLLFSPGDYKELFQQLNKIESLDIEKLRNKTLSQFEHHLSHQAIAFKIANALLKI